MAHADGVQVLQREADLAHEQRGVALGVRPVLADALEHLAARHEVKHEPPCARRAERLNQADAVPV